MKFWSENSIFHLKCQEKNSFLSMLLLFENRNARERILEISYFSLGECCEHEINERQNTWHLLHHMSSQTIFETFSIALWSGESCSEQKIWPKLVWDLLTWPQCGNSGWSGLSIEPGCLSKGNDGTIDSIHRKSITFNSQNLVHCGVNLN